MTPDTSAYMTAGFVVIFSGMGFYLLSLFLRSGTIKRKLDREKEKPEDQD